MNSKNQLILHDSDEIIIICTYVYYIYSYFREIEDKDIITPEMGRAVAKEIGAYYYETSVLENYGIEDVSYQSFVVKNIQLMYDFYCSRKSLMGKLNPKVIVHIHFKYNYSLGQIS